MITAARLLLRGEVMVDYSQPLPTSGREWTTRAAIWARAIAAVGILVAGLVMLISDGDIYDPGVCFMTLVFGGPAVLYVLLSFFLGRWHGNVCIFLVILATAQLVALLISMMLLARRTGLAGFLNEVYELMVFAFAAGLVSLIVSAFWARREQRTSNGDPRIRGFEVMGIAPDQLIVSDREK